MKKEIKTKRRVSVDDSRMAYAKSISTKARKSASEGIRIALDYHKANHPDLDQPKDYPQNHEE